MLRNSQMTGDPNMASAFPLVHHDARAFVRAFPKLRWKHRHIDPMGGELVWAQFQCRLQFGLQLPAPLLLLNLFAPADPVFGHGETPKSPWFCGWTKNPLRTG